jgi:thiamine pyrophosphokinase
MLGVVFAGGEGPQAEIIRQLFEHEAAGALTAAADSGLLLAESAGVRPDLITGDMDSLDAAEERLAAYSPERVLRHAVDKDFTDTELALSLLFEKGCDAVWILGGGGGRIDHLFGVRSLFERPRFPARWITAAEDMYCIEAGGEISLRLAAGALVSVFPLGGGRWKAVSRGLQWPLDGLAWNRGFFGLSNVALTGDVFIKAEQGRFMVIVPRPPCI